MARVTDPLSKENIQRLKTYTWPGNVRELQNVIERAVITSRVGQLNLDHGLPQNAADTETNSPSSQKVTSDKILTIKDMLNLERDNLIAALTASNWRVSGDKGAAQLLKMPPSTLSSRMKVLGIKRPG